MYRFHSGGNHCLHTAAFEIYTHIHVNVVSLSPAELKEIKKIPYPRHSCFVSCSQLLTATPTAATVGACVCFPDSATWGKMPPRQTEAHFPAKQNHYLQSSSDSSCSRKDRSPWPGWCSAESWVSGWWRKLTGVPTRDIALLQSLANLTCKVYHYFL